MRMTDLDKAIKALEIKLSRDPGDIAGLHELAGLRLTGGERVLDLGCGLGDDTFEIARVVGSRGRAVSYAEKSVTV